MRCTAPSPRPASPATRDEGSILDRLPTELLGEVFTHLGVSRDMIHLGQMPGRVGAVARDHKLYAASLTNAKLTEIGWNRLKEAPRRKRPRQLADLLEHVSVMSPSMRNDAVRMACKAGRQDSRLHNIATLANNISALNADQRSQLVPAACGLRNPVFCANAITSMAVAFPDLPEDAAEELLETARRLPPHPSRDQAVAALRQQGASIGTEGL